MSRKGHDPLFFKEVRRNPGLFLKKRKVFFSKG